jgi:D-galactarolactone cycloisomerase
MKISSIEAIPVRLPREREKAVRTAGSPTALVGSGDYRWSAVFPTLYAVNFETALIKITLDSGLEGWGEAQAPLAPEVACAIIDLLLKPVLLDASFDGSIPEIEGFWNQMYSTMRVRGQTGGFMLDAISGVDIALWDLAGKIQERPVCELIPGSAKRGEVPAYYSGIPGATTGDRVADALRQREEGFRNFKIFYDCGRDEFFEAFRGLRKALGNDAGLAVDALWRLSPQDAPCFGRELDEGRALWLEAPLAPEDPLAHSELARRIRTPLALGESYRTRYELAAFFRGAAELQKACASPRWLPRPALQ